MNEENTVARSAKSLIVSTLRGMASSAWAHTYEHEQTLTDAANLIERLEQRIVQLETSRNVLSSETSFVKCPHCGKDASDPKAA